MEYFDFTEQTIDSAVREQLREEVLTKSHPLGPSSLEFAIVNQDGQLYQHLFDDHSKYLYEEHTDRPSIIIGRKGAGKSSYLNNLSQKSNVVPIKIISWNILTEV